jgi:hypothetical protein
MSYHKDPEVNKAIIRLLDTLCSWERNTGRRSTLLLIPHNDDEEMIMAQDGKPVDSYMITPEHLLEIAELERERSP